MFSVMGFFLFLIFAGFILSMATIDIYNRKINAQRWVRSFAGVFTFWLFLMLLAFRVSFAEQPVTFALLVLDFFVVVAPWVIGLWFAQLCLIEDRRQADRRSEPSTTAAFTPAQA